MIFNIESKKGDPKVTIISTKSIDNVDIITRDRVTKLSFICTRGLMFAESSSWWFSYPAALETSGLIIELWRNGEIIESHEVDFGTNVVYPTSFSISSGEDTFSWYGYKEIFLQKQYGDVTGFKTAVDIGGNIGLFSIYCHVNKVERILTVEPDRANITHLEKNRDVISGGKGWQIVRGGISYADGSSIFGRYNHGNSSSLFIKNGQLEESYDITTYNINTLLSQIAGDIDILKLDCEGGEFAIIRTMNDHNFGRIKNIACEIHECKYMSAEEIICKLELSGFIVNVISPMHESIMTIYASKNNNT